jgi:polyisoprenyl-phosphate glycosyltransferase
LPSRPRYKEPQLSRNGGRPRPHPAQDRRDGSSDNTLELLRALKAADPTICIVDLSRNFGKEIALTAGLDYARGDVVIVIDADLQHPPELIPRFISRWQEEDTDVVYGLRASRTGESRVKRFTSRAFYRVINSLSGDLIPVDAGDFRILSWHAVDALAGARERHRYMKGLFAWIGYRQIPMLYEPMFDMPAQVSGITGNYGIFLLKELLLLVSDRSKS